MSHSFVPDDIVLFESEFVTHLPPECEDYFYSVPVGTRGKVIETTDDSVLVRIAHPRQSWKETEVHLYTADSSRSKRGGVACIVKWKAGSGGSPPFASPDSAGVPVSTDDHAERSKIPPPNDR